MKQTVTDSARALFSAIVDYAGLFPPASLSMRTAVRNYAEYIGSDCNWMLGRFIVPAGRLAEFREQAAPFFAGEREPWLLSVLALDSIADTVESIKNFNRENNRFAVCDTLEIKVENSAEIYSAKGEIPDSVTSYFELPLDENLADSIGALAISGQRAKIRTGGITPEAFPPALRIIKFLRLCLAANVAFKCTAGLHHPVRSRRPLTYETSAPTGIMHGFLNVFLAAAFLRQGQSSDFAVEVMEDELADNFLFEDGGVLWRREFFVSTNELKYLKTRGAVSFGSCSFEEPVTDLEDIGILR
jgi:hypothetical protein